MSASPADYAAFCIQNEQLIDDTVRDVMTDRAAEAEESGDRVMARRIRRCLIRPRIYNRVISYIESTAVAQYLATPEAQAGGDFLKWFLDWFASGGWEAVLEFIKALLPLLVGLTSVSEDDEAAEDRLFTAFDEKFGDGAIGD